MLNVLGLIPARGGSKGIPRKNVCSLGGRPLIAYTIEAARAAERLARVVVSTDDLEITEVARRHGAEVPFRRPARYATDTASSTSVVLHALDWFKRHDGYVPDAVALLAPTAPLRTGRQIDDCVDLLASSGLDTAMTVVPTESHPYFVYRLEEGNCLREILSADGNSQRRQDLPAFYDGSQAVIVTRRAYFERAGERAPVANIASAVGLVIDRESAWDIDTFLDWTIVEHLLLLRRESPLGVTPAGGERA